MRDIALKMKQNTKRLLSITLRSANEAIERAVRAQRRAGLSDLRHVDVDDGQSLFWISVSAKLNGTPQYFLEKGDM